MGIAPLALFSNVLGGLLTAGGIATSIIGGVRASSASRRAEKLREQQLRLESTRRRREAIRQFQLQRATALSNITGATGSVLGGGSAIGGLGGLTSNLSTQLNTISQAEDIGTGIFKANADYASAQGLQSIGGGMQSFGGQLFQNSQAIGRIGSTLYAGI